MSNCAVCGSSDARPRYNHKGIFYGNSCHGVCDGLLWEAHFLEQTKAQEEECAQVLRMWRRQRAAVERATLGVPEPKSKAELALESALADAGIIDIARELA